MSQTGGQRTRVQGPFRLPTRVLFGSGALRQVAKVVEQAVARGLGAPDPTVVSGRVLLVCDGGLVDTPWPRKTRQVLREAGWEVEVFDAVEPNPRDTTVDAIASEARRRSATAVVGLGGGSVLDAAKAAAQLVARGGTVADVEGSGLLATPSVPFIAIPTTCGTGSEVTWVSVITVAQRRVKISLKGDGMFPAAALVDPQLLTSLPAPLVASTALDALTHAVEAYVGCRANPASDTLAREAVSLIFRYLRRGVVAIGDDAEAREGLMNASTLAGMAFGNADVGAVHCLSESLGGLFDVPHGLTNALLLAPTLRAHGDSVADPLGELATTALGVPGGGAEAFLDTLETLVDDLRLPPFASLGVPAGQEETIAQLAVANGSNGSNPRPMGAAEYLEILARVS